MKDFLDSFTEMIERAEKEAEEAGPPLPEPKFLWGCVIPEDKDEPVRVINKPYRGPWATSALNRAQKECSGNDTYGCVGADTYEDAVAEAAHNRARGFW